MNSIKNRALIHSLLIVAALFLYGCQQAPQFASFESQLKLDGGYPCMDDSDCEEWEFCDYGTCTDGGGSGSGSGSGSGECYDDSDCEEGYICMAGFCSEDYFNNYCTDDSDCEEGFVCLYGYCQEDYYECYNDEDCGPGYWCSAGYCEEDYFDCYTDEECGPGYYCMDGYCEWDGWYDCEYDEDCMPGQTCQGGICVGGSQLCFYDSDCPQGQVCADGVCRAEDQGCATNYDCPQGQICDPQTFTCVDDPGDCYPACGSGFVCQDGSCLPCGGLDQICCPINSCNGDLQCQSGTCSEDSGCTDDCTPGSTQCADQATILTCGDFDDDACYEPGDPQPCDVGQVCQIFTADSGACRDCGDKWDPCCPGDACNNGLVCDNGTCNDSSSGCTDECSMFTSARKCSEDATRGEGTYECGNFDDDSCLEYGPFTPCDTGMICRSGRCVPDCGDDCDPPVDTLSRCEDDYTRSECLDLIEGTCVTWGDPIACASGTRCSDGACVQCDFLDVCDGIDNNCNGVIDEDDDCSGYAAAGCSCSLSSTPKTVSSLFMLLFLAALIRRRVNENH